MVNQSDGGRDCDILPDDNEEKYWKQYKRIIRYYMFEDEDKKQTIDKMMKNLKVWVNGLPNLNNPTLDK